MRVFIDEDLTPRLTETAQGAGYESSCITHRNLSGIKDWDLATMLLEGEWVLVTNNAGDFLKIAKKEGVHPGLIFMEEGSIAEEQAWLAVALEHIHIRARVEGQIEAAFMLNRVIDVARDGSCEDYAWP